jgi:AraC-like DNA-binding protein
MSSTDTLSVASLNMLLWAAGQRGADVEALRQAIGLDAATAANPDARLPIATMQRLWQLSVTATGDEHLDLHLGQLFNPAALGIVAYVLLNSPTLGAALQQLCRYQDVACQGVRTSLQPAKEFPGGAWLTLELTSPAIIYPEYVFNSELSVYLAAFRVLTGQAVVPQVVRLAYPRPADTREHERVFAPAIPEFDAPLTALAFDAATLAQPILNANPALFILFEQHADALLAQLPQQLPLTLPEQVRREIIRQLKGQVPALAAVADQLCMGVRTLQLHLREAGHSYQGLLDEVRQELALRHLHELHLSTTDIAFLLGYSDPSVFVRSFRKWTGQPPGRYRQQLMPTA